MLLLLVIIFILNISGQLNNGLKKHISIAFFKGRISLNKDDKQLFSVKTKNHLSVWIPDNITYPECEITPESFKYVIFINSSTGVFEML